MGGIFNRRNTDMRMHIACPLESYSKVQYDKYLSLKALMIGFIMMPCNSLFVLQHLIVFACSIFIGYRL